MPAGKRYRIVEVGDTAPEEVDARLADPIAAKSITLPRSWIALAPTDQEGIREAEEDLALRATGLPISATGGRFRS